MNRCLQGMFLMAVLLLAVVPRGSAIMRCNHTGALYLSGWENPGCVTKGDSEGHCCGQCDYCKEEGIDRDCCDIIGVFDGDPLVQEKDAKLQTPLAVDLPPVTFVEPPKMEVDYSLVEPLSRPDPPGIPLQVAYSTFLI